MSKRGAYHGGSTVIGWTGAPRSTARRPGGGPGLLAIEARAAKAPAQPSAFMPPTGPAPAARPPHTKPARKKTPISEAELVHFSFGGRARDRVLDDLDPIVLRLAQNGFRKPADVARLLNGQGVRTACGEPWTRQLARFLLDFLFERRRDRRTVRSSRAAASAVRATPVRNEPLTTEEIARRLSALGRIGRSD